MDVYSLVALIIYSLFLILTLVAIIIFGEGNVDSFKLTGPFAVGHKDLFTTEDGVEMSVYYPMDKEEYTDTIQKEPHRNSLIFRHGYKSRLGLSKCTAKYGTDDHKHPWFFKYLDDVRMNAC